MRTLDPIERKKLWDQLDDAAQKLGVLTLPRLHIGMRVEKGGVVLADQREEGHSWTRNMWNAIFSNYAHCGASAATFGAGYISSKNTAGTVIGSTTNSGNLLYSDRDVPASSYGFCYNGTSSGWGIVVGTGNTAFSTNDYNLASIIAAGSGAGQLTHNAMDPPSLDYTSNIWTASLARTFDNESGDTITVKEVGIISKSLLFTGTTGYYFLLARDVLGSPVDVVNGAQLTVTYEISMDFSSIDT